MEMADGQNVIEESDNINRKLVTATEEWTDPEAANSVLKKQQELNIQLELL